MKLFLLLFSILTALCGCSGTPLELARGAADLLAPPAVVNPYVRKAVPLCSASLDASQVERLDAAMSVWNTAYPPARLTHTDRCLPGMPVVNIDPSIGDQRSGYTIPSLPEGVRISFRSDADMTPCVTVHELGHYLGLLKHAAKSEPEGPMRDRERGDCAPTAADVAILVRTYEGMPSW